MREPADADRIKRFMQALGAATPREDVCYLADGATAALLGWRPTTIAVAIELDPEQDEVLRALPAIKNELRINVDLASPRDFIPLPPGWEERSPSVAREGLLTFKHFDLYSQALAKLERGHAQDLEDVRLMFERGLIEADRLAAAVDELEPSSTGGFRQSTHQTSAGGSRNS